MSTRRRFIQNTASVAVLAGCGVPTGGRRAAGSDQGPPTDGRSTRPDRGAAPPDETGPVFDTGGWEDTGVDAASCTVSAPLDEGPYFRDAAPDRTDLRTTGDGTTFHLVLTVRSGTDCRPLPGAIVEIWHCDPDGSYDLTTSDMHFRARVRADFAGQVRLTTWKPVPYPLDDERMMPAHVHLKVAADGFAPLTTQLRFVDDPHDDGMCPPSLMLAPTVAADGSEDAAHTLVLDRP